MSKLRGFIRLMRPINCVMMGFAVFVGALLAVSQPFQGNWLNIIFGFFTGFVLCGAAMTINDYYDRSIDAVNEPTRPIPSGLVSVRDALVFVFVLKASEL
jgi:4-hydroxybenzoate polyprenyltransferase